MTLKTGLTVLMLTLSWVAAKAEERIALIVGNGDYTQVSSLTNPVSDASLIAETLEMLGFQVTLLTNASQIDMKRAIAQFGRDLRNGGSDATGLFYYAGHGVQSMSTNYLLPVDITVQDEADFDILGVEADWVLRQMYSARNKTNIVILDACRNNPFEALGDVIRDGLAEMNAPTGTFLSYATAPGAVAADGLGANSPFTTALAEVITTPGVQIEQAFKQVRVAVLEQTGGLQTPWDSSSLTDDFFFVAGETMTAEEVAEQQLWDSVKTTNDPVQVMLYLRGYPDSTHADEARALLKSLMQSELQASVEAAEVAPAPAPEPAPEPAQPKEPTAQEMALIEQAQASGASADYKAYLEAYPGGVFADLAAIELDAAMAKEAKAAEAAAASATASTEPEAPAEEVEMASRAANTVGAAPISFNEPLVHGSEAIVGRTIADLITGSPLFPPVEGLPEEYWKDQSCSNCHQWEQTNLCEQGGRYLSLNAQSALGKEHPYGGTFKQTLRAWAASGCN